MVNAPQIVGAVQNHSAASALQIVGAVKNHPPAPPALQIVRAVKESGTALRVASAVKKRKAVAR